jgi:hypothetical protein
MLLACGSVHQSGTAASGAQTTQLASPTAPSASAPEQRLQETIAYDGASGHLIMFGGKRTTGGREALGDTWVWGQNGWSAVPTQQGPSPRSGALTTYDPIRRKVVLFGGQSNQLLLDTWAWDGGQWLQQYPSDSPPPAWVGAGNLTFDAGRGETILFGNTLRDETTFTWAWSGSGWVQKQLATQPPWRFESAMAYDGASKSVILFGGRQQEAEASFLHDTWIWNGATWAQIASTGTTSPTGGPAYAAFDEKTNKVWLLTLDGSMWIWSGTSWNRQGTFPSLANRRYASMLFDGSLGKIVLFGGAESLPSGNTIKSDLWAWDGQNWAQLA